MFVDITLPVISRVSVFIPSLISAIYSFASLVRISTSFVYLPITHTRTPLAMGSRVPVCPIFLVLKIWLS